MSPRLWRLIQWAGAAALVGTLLGTGYAAGATLERTDHNQTRAELADIHERNTELWQQVSFCRSAAEYGRELNDAWHVWKDDRSAETADAVNQHQDALWERLAQCETREESTA